MSDYVVAGFGEIAYALEEESKLDSEESEIFHQMVKDFQQECVRIIAAASIPDSNEDSLNKQHQCHVELNYLETKLEHLKCIREAYEEEKHAWEENLSFFKTPLSLTSTEAGDCTFDGINDTTTLSNLYEDSGTLLSTLRDVRDTKNEILEVRQQLVQAYHQDTLTRWNANDFAFSSVEPD
ncbi:hypothetical protein WA538_004768, partial [Blastocystis sp. DL]